MRHKKVVILLAVAALGVAAAGYAQRFGGGRRRGYTYYGTINRADKNSFTGDFTFCRIMFRQAPDGDGNGWGVDYPRADENLSIRLSELTKSRVNFDKNGDPNHYVMQATEEELFNCPFVMMTEPGGTYFDENEAKALRAYMLKGGFLWADDFWGEYAWAHWVGEVRKIFPGESEYPIIDVPLNHSMFHSLFDVTEFPQIPGIGVWERWHTTSERGADSATPHARAILDAKGRIMFFMTHNTDFGDGYEREGDDPTYFYKFSVPGYAVGIDLILYEMTH
jgi:hypothetical protein